MHKIDLLLINPGNRLEQFANLNTLATVAQPLGIASLAAYAREHGLSVAIIDAEAEFWTPEDSLPAILEYDPALIGFTAFTTKMTAVEKTALLIKEHMDVPVCLGGHHASAIPGNTLETTPQIDYIIAGEGYEPIVALTKSIKTGKLKPFIEGVWYRDGDTVHDGGRASFGKDLDIMPHPAWDLLPMNKYRAHHWQGWGKEKADLSKFGLLYTSLGCPFRCDFCTVNVVYGKRYARYMSPERVADELEVLVRDYGVKFVELIDDTFTLNTKRVHAVCDAIIAKGLNDEMEMWCFARTDRTDPDLLQKMRRAGITWVFMGLESGTDDILLGVEKRQTISDIKEACNKVHDADINIGGNFIFGLRDDTFETMQKTLDLALDVKPEYVNMFIMQAYPSTVYYDMAKEKGWPLPTKWGQYGFFAPDALPLRNDTLSARDILEFRDSAFITYFSNSDYHDVIRNRFGQETVDFINQHILSKRLVRKYI